MANRWLQKQITRKKQRQQTKVDLEYMNKIRENEEQKLINKIKKHYDAGNEKSALALVSELKINKIVQNETRDILFRLNNIKHQEWRAEQSVALVKKMSEASKSMKEKSSRIKPSKIRKKTQNFQIMTEQVLKVGELVKDCMPDEEEFYLSEEEEEDNQMLLHKIVSGRKNEQTDTKISEVPSPSIHNTSDSQSITDELLEYRLAQLKLP